MLYKKITTTEGYIFVFPNVSDTIIRRRVLFIYGYSIDYIHLVVLESTASDYEQIYNTVNVESEMIYHEVYEEVVFKQRRSFTKEYHE